MKIDVGKIALVAVLIAGVQTNTLYHRIDDLECQRDIYKSRYQRTYTSSSGNTYVYAPNFTIYGSMNAEDLRSIMDEGYEKFCEYVERYEREKRRTQYGT